jgi:hypothetical protein
VITTLPGITTRFRRIIIPVIIRIKKDNTPKSLSPIAASM